MEEMLDRLKSSILHFRLKKENEDFTYAEARKIRVEFGYAMASLLDGDVESAEYFINRAESLMH